jgi:hypothetical protein
VSDWRRRWGYLWELASEREATTAEPELDGGRGRAPARSGGPGAIPRAPGAPLAAPDAPMPAGPQGGIQRAPADAPLAPPTNPVVLRESVRVALMWHHRAQQRPGEPAGPTPPIALTPQLEEQLLRLMPSLDAEALARLWDPPPEDWMVGLHRLTAAGHLPRMTLVPERVREPALDPRALAPLPPGPEREREGRLSPFGAGMVGLHFRVKPRRQALPEENIAAALRGRGLALRDDELKALLAGRRQGIEQIDSALSKINTGLDPAQRRRIAETIADVLLDKSLEGQLVRERPTGAEREQERQRIFEPEGPGGLRGLVEKLPVGASITFHFP